jgi:hypothetical protein
VSDALQIEAKIEPLLVLDVQTQLVSHVLGTPVGDRAAYDIVGGRFEGARLRGLVPASGGDWTTRTSIGSLLDVRLLLRTDDGVTILLRYSGTASARADGVVRIEVAGRFEAPPGAYAWLNPLQAFGLGAPTPNGVRYQFYHFQ